MPDLLLELFSEEIPARMQARAAEDLQKAVTGRLVEAGLVASVGRVGDNFDNALPETINGPYKAEVIHRRGPWRSLEGVDYATLE